jgi:hypothetical protein
VVDTIEKQDKNIQGKRLLGRPMRRWETITMDLKETGLRFVDCSCGPPQSPAGAACEHAGFHNVPGTFGLLET